MLIEEVKDESRMLFGFDKREIMILEQKITKNAKSEALSVVETSFNIYNIIKRQNERKMKMKSSELLKMRMKIHELSKYKLLDDIGCSEKTLRKYLNGSTTSGPYLTLILERLDISVSEWNECSNVKRDMMKEDQNETVSNDKKNSIGSDEKRK